MTKARGAAPTRGFGVLERYLAQRRAKRADLLIPDHYRNGRVLDVGCGTTPFFLESTQFRESYGIDRNPQAPFWDSNIRLVAFDLDAAPALPFTAESFTVVTMLAVAEHLMPERLALVVNDVFRVLEPNGLLVITTPAGWTAPLLKLLAAMGLVSRAEIAEHKVAYSQKMLLRLFEQTRFEPGNVRIGGFELGANNWAVAKAVKAP